jgi:hypothetical protein
MTGDEPCFHYFDDDDDDDGVPRDGIKQGISLESKVPSAVS